MAANSARDAKTHKSRFAVLAETISNWEDEVTPPSAKSVILLSVFTSEITVRGITSVDWRSVVSDYVCDSGFSDVEKKHVPCCCL